MSQYLTFTLAEELFAIDIGKVLEVLDCSSVTRVPGTPEFMRGVVNLRGNVVPVVDMRRKFGMPAREGGGNTYIVIVEVEVDGESTVLGALADTVQEVLHLAPEQIEPAPRIGTRLNVEFLQGMGKRDDSFIMLLDIDKVFNIDELAAVAATAEPALLAS